MATTTRAKTAARKQSTRKPKPSKVVRTQALELVDAAGAVQARLSTRPDGGPGLHVADPQGKSRALVEFRTERGTFTFPSTRRERPGSASATGMGRGVSSWA